ncbi:MAG: peptidyl-prolyl cis-trans isomerase [Rhodospirillaceae bacterium]|nr:peptidyl-prolyl cis-trans isomerase [Rhodospirillaceae bacterium]
MIQWFKDVTADSIVFKVFMGVMILSFGIWGIGDVIAPPIDPNVAIQGGRFEVRASEVQRRYDVQIEGLRENLGNEAASDPSLKRVVLDNTVNELRQLAVTNMAAMELGIDVSDERVRDNVHSQEAFKDESGAFNQLRFMQVLGQNGLTEGAFATLVKNDLRQQTFLQPVSVNAAAPKALVDPLFAYRGETRIADTLLIPVDKMTVPAAPTDEQVKKTYDENISAFTAPEYRSFEVVVLTRADLVPPDSLDEAAVRAYYDENAARYHTPEKRRVAQLLFDTQAQAEAARALAAPGDTLAKIAEKAKIGPPMDLGERTSDDAVLAAFGAAAKIGVNEISQPVQTDLGWHLLEVQSLIPEQVTPYEQVSAEVRKLLAEEKAADAIAEVSVRLEDEIAAGTPMDEAAKAVGAIHWGYDSISRDGKVPGNMTLMSDDITARVPKDKLLATAFLTPVGTESPLNEIDGGYYIVKVNSSAPPAPKPMDSVRPEIVRLWEQQERAAAAKALAEKLVTSIGPSSVMSAEMDKDSRLSYAKLGPITRFGESLTRDYVVDSKRVGPEMLEKLFQAKPGEVFTAPVLGGYVVARLIEAVPAKPEGEMAKVADDVSQSTRQAMSQDLLEQFSRALNARFPVTLNTKAINDIAGLATPE